jgi:protein-tyrosine phosphatase
MTERLLASGLADLFGEASQGVTVMSAGVRGVEGRPMAPHATQVLLEFGADPADFSGQDLTADAVSRADLVLCAAREHRSAVVTLVPQALRRTFTLREFARLIAGVSPAEIARECLADQIPALAHAANRRRGYSQPARPAFDDISDPAGHPITVFRVCAQDILGCLEAALRLLAEAGSPEGDDTVRRIW